MFKMSKSVIERKMGRSIEEVSKLSLEEEKELVEEKTGRKLEWPKFFRKRPIRTMRDVDARLDEICGRNAPEKG